jgi:CysZ protein
MIGNTMFSGLFLAIEQLGDPRIRGVIIRAVLISAALFVGLMFAAGWLLSGLSVFGISWIDSAVSFLGGGAAFVIGLFLFPAFTGIIISFMLEEIASAVEARHYPNLPAAREEPVMEMVGNAVRFTGVTVFLNLLVFILVVPIMLVTIVLIPFIPFVFYALNGYLLGREYFEFAAVRRLDPAPGRTLRRQFRIRVFMCGIAIAVLMTIPFVNWLMPVVAASYMVHVFEGVRGRAAGA